jgi:hypothetical protein
MYVLSFLARVNIGFAKQAFQAQASGPQQLQHLACRHGRIEPSQAVGG